MPTPRFAFNWLLVNAIGMVVFLVVASQFWVEPEFADEPGYNLGDAFGWLLCAVPILILFFIGNLVRLVATLRAVPSQWRPALLLYVQIGGLWMAAFIFDGLHHGA
jgi:hypothetical protein